MFCKNCGSEVASSYKLCPQCGEKEFSPTRIVPNSQAATTQRSTAIQSPIGNAVQGTASRNTVLVAGTVGLIVVLGGFFGIKTWESAKVEAEVKKQQELAKIELDRKRKEMELELERKRLEEEALRNQERARIAAQQERESQDRQNRIASARDAIKALEFHSRPSMMYEGTKVLQINNIRAVSISFDLKCCTANNNCRTMPVSIDPQSTKDIGFLEGWSGNFVAGETCEVRYQDETMRSIRFN